MNKIYWAIILMFLMVFNAQASAPRYKKHIVVKGETLYSIAHSYGLKVADLAKVNPVLKTKTELRLGQQLNIPSSAHLILAEATKPVRKDTLARKAKVAAIPSTPDTPYREEERPVHSSIETKNALSTTSNDNPVLNTSKTEKVISPGIVDSKINTAETMAPAESKPETAAVVPFSIRTNSANPGDYAALFNQYGARNYAVKRNRGAANYLGDNSPGNPYLALYSGAETGSVIKVTNMMNNKSVYVKVVGKVPPADASKEVILKLSHKVAQELGAIDEKFLVEVAGVPAN